MERSLLKELTNVNLVAYINRQRDAILRKTYYQLFFPLKQTLTLDWETLSGSSGIPVMADVIEYNASAPLKTRDTVTHATGDIPKMSLKRRMDEKDLLEYQIYKTLARGDSDKAAILDIVFNDVDFVNAGVQARTEFLAMQALSYGAINLDATNNNGIITETEVDFGIPSGNKAGVAVVWSDIANSTPITDIETKVTAADDNGDFLEFMLMDKTTFGYFKNSTQVRDKYAYYQGILVGRVSNPGIDDLNAMLKKDGLPTIVIIDSKGRYETFDHVRSNVNSWKANYVTFIPDYNVGKFLHGPIAEENSPEVKKIATTAKVGHIWVKKWSILDPYAELTAAEANAFPTFTDVTSIYMMNTNNVTTWS